MNSGQFVDGSQWLSDQERSDSKPKGGMSVFKGAGNRRVSSQRHGPWTRTAPVTVSGTESRPTRDPTPPYPDDGRLLKGTLFTCCKFVDLPWVVSPLCLTKTGVLEYSGLSRLFFRSLRIPGRCPVFLSLPWLRPEPQETLTSEGCCVRGRVSGQHLCWLYPPRLPRPLTIGPIRHWLIRNPLVSCFDCSTLLLPHY